MPDTYVFRRGKTRDELVAAHDARRSAKLLDELWASAHRICRSKTKEEALILASIVEKETGVAGGAAARRRGLRQSAAAGHAAAVRSDHHLRHHRRQGQARPAAHPSEDIARRRPTTPIASTACRRRPIANPGREAIAGGAQSGRHRRSSISSPTARAGTPLPRRSTSTTRNVAKWRKIEQADDAPAPARRRRALPAAVTGGRLRPQRDRARGAAAPAVADAADRRRRAAERAGASSEQLAAARRPTASSPARAAAAATPADQPKPPAAPCRSRKRGRSPSPRPARDPKPGERGHGRQAADRADPRAKASRRAAQRCPLRECALDCRAVLEHVSRLGFRCLCRA